MLEIPELDLALNKGAVKPKKPIPGQEMWNVAARSNRREKVVILNGKRVK